jgi:hypothetical protein
MTIENVPSSQPVAAIAWFLVWVVIGVGVAVGVVSLGLLTLVPSLCLAAVVAASPTARRSAFGLVVGLGVLLLFVAYVQRQGPGTTCWRTATSSGCDQHLDPRPWLVAGLTMIALGFVGAWRSGLAGRLRRATRVDQR